MQKSRHLIPSSTLMSLLAVSAPVHASYAPCRKAVRSSYQEHQSQSREHYACHDHHYTLDLAHARAAIGPGASEEERTVRVVLGQSVGEGMIVHRKDGPKCYLDHGCQKE